MTIADHSPAHIDDGHDAPELFWGAGSRIAVRLAASDTNGTIGVTHFTAAPGESVPLHLHTREDEVFLVASGSVELVADGETRTVSAGGVAFLPRGSEHRYTVLASGAEFFVVTTPGGFERFFAAAGIAVGDRSDNDLSAAWSRERTNEIEQHIGTGLRWLHATESLNERETSK